MTTLREAAKAVLDRWDSSEYAASDLFEELRAALEQQEQEPVAWTTMPESEDWCFVSGGKDPTGKLEGKWFPLYTHPPQRKPLTEEQDASRYRWLRDRLQVRYMQAVSSEKRRGLVLRVGHGFLDSKTPPERGWTDPRYFDECRQEVDAAIDAAIEQAHGIGEKP